MVSTGLFNFCVIHVCMKSPLTCCVLSWKALCVCVTEMEMVVGVGAAAVAWGEVLPWFSLEFLCFWSQNEGGNWICVALGALLLEVPAHFPPLPSQMVLRGSSVFKAKNCREGVFFFFYTFQWEETREKKVTASDMQSHTWRGWWYLNVYFLHV